ncbi:MAG: phosphoribosylanthranilate isomerase [Phycisphaeraceae bacterium]|nr:phosphoribosylanthranilate isomerase [Phycisphaeraceae bacterium]MCB9848127.1 phosphoribosylanthranilate isomerase [Phycisphaeraceae bacterium]
MTSLWSAPARTRIKICGIRDEATAHAALAAGADTLGFVFHKASPRFIEPDEAWAIIQTLPPMHTTVGLTVGASVEAYSRIERQCPTDFGQLHGDEPEEVVRACGPRVIKAVRFDRATIAAQLRRWGAVDEVDAVLVDGSAGGMGEAFDWSALAGACGECAKPIILAGGLNAANVGEAIRVVRPWAVDVSSGVERERGVKDAGMIREFCAAVRAADAALA